MSGPSRAASWSAPARLEPPSKATPSRCPPTATPPSWAGPATTRAPGRRGSSPAAAVSGPSRAASWSAPARLETPEQGCSVALSADGNTAIVGGPVDNDSSTGAAWVFTRSGGVWTQQGSKLVGTGAVGTAATKASPSRCPPTATPPSWAGLTTTRTSGRRGSTPAAAVSGPSRAASWSAPARLETPNKATPSRCPPTATPPSWAGHCDNSSIGAAWVYTRSGGVWTQQGSKLVGTGAVGTPSKAPPSRCPATATPPSWAGLATTPQIGAAWVYTRSATLRHWTQQGSKLVGTGAVGPADQGWSVALSADGNTAIVGGPADIRRSTRRRGGVGLCPAVVASHPHHRHCFFGDAGWPVLAVIVQLHDHRHGGSVNYSIITPSWLTASPASGTVTTSTDRHLHDQFQCATPWRPLPTPTASISSTRAATRGIGRVATLTVNAKLFKITVRGVTAGDGSVNGGGTFAEGSSQTVTAMPDCGSRLVHWTKNGKVVS